MNKRGQGLSVNAIIMIVLGVVVLAVLILGFTMGWKNIAPWLGGGDNVDTIVKACDVACGTQSVYDYCTVKRDLKADGVELKDVTCNYLAKEKSVYGVNTCSSVPCDDIILVDESDEINCNENVGKTFQYLEDNGLKRHDCSTKTETLLEAGHT